MWIFNIFISVFKFAIKHTVELINDIFGFFLIMKSKKKNKENRGR